MGPSAERGGRSGAVGVAQPGEEERPAERGGDVVPEESQRPDAGRAAQDRQRQANAVGEPHEQHDAGVVVADQAPGPRDGRLPAGRETREQRVAVAAAQREVDLVSGDRRDAGHERDRPPRPVALCCERAASRSGTASALSEAAYAASNGRWLGGRERFVRTMKASGLSRCSPASTANPWTSAPNANRRGRPRRAVQPNHANTPARYAMKAVAYSLISDSPNSST